MKRIFFLSLLYGFGSFFLLHVVGHSYAQQPTDNNGGAAENVQYNISVDPPPTPFEMPPDTDKTIQTNYRDFIFPPGYVDENTKTVTITFTGLDPSKKYITCLYSAAEDCQFAINNDSNGFQGIQPNSYGTITHAVCADGKSRLKFAKDNKNCNDKTDYFWAQHIYNAFLLRKAEGNESSQTKSGYIVLSTVSFYVAHYYPTVKLNSLSTKNGNDISLTIQGRRRLQNDSNRNDYKIELASVHDPGHVLAYSCRAVRDDKPITVQFQYNSDILKNNNSYEIRINEQVNEHGGSSLIGSVFSGFKNPIGFFNPVVNSFLVLKDLYSTATENCEAGFTYEKIDFPITTYGIGTNGSTGGVIDYTRDPNQVDIGNLANTEPPPPPPPCKEIDAKTGNCRYFNTAVGTIDTQPAGFIKSVLTLLLSLAGGIAVLLIIIAGYQFLSSQGNPERIQAARERLISAIVGLLVIIFSIVLLQVITVDILQLPGFKP